MSLNDLKHQVKDVLRSTDLDEKVGVAANRMKNKVQQVLDKTDLDEKIKAGADMLREKTADVDTDALRAQLHEGTEMLKDEVQKVLDEMKKDGTTAKISEAWFGKDITKK